MLVMADDAGNDDVDDDYCDCCCCCCCSRCRRRGCWFDSHQNQINEVGSDQHSCPYARVPWVGLKRQKLESSDRTGVPTHVKKEYEDTYDSFAWQSTAVGSTHSSQNVLTDWDDVKGEDVKEAWSWQEDDADAAEDAGLGADRHGDEDPQAESGFVLQTIQKSS